MEWKLISLVLSSGYSLITFLHIVHILYLYTFILVKDSIKMMSDLAR